jgi:hydrogenase expression/formation protein HypC
VATGATVQPDCRQSCLDFVPEAKVGDYVLVHVGFAISVVDKEDAERTYALLESMGVLSEGLAIDPGVPQAHEIPG